MRVVEEIKARLDIVEVVSSYLPLKPAGRAFKALCPFHTEKTPSFFVFPERGTWRCFGACATGGDIFAFVMKMENIPFGEALRRLAGRAGVSLPSRSAGPSTTPQARALEAAARFYHHALLSSREAEGARRYLEGRGISPESISAFLLGYSPPSGEALKRHLQAQGFTEGDLLTAGLLFRAETGRTRDLFRGRLMFPIHDPTGRVVGFGGRSLDGSEPKYLNSPRTALFDKGRLLYGLHRAGEAVRRTGRAIVVEGYFDVIMAHQKGFPMTVASMGTALTGAQASLLRGMAREVVLALDPDAAGQEATLRSLETSFGLFQRPPLQYRQRGGLVIYERGLSLALKIALLPPGKDPDALLREDPQRWREAVEGARDVVDFLFDVLPARMDLSTPQGRLQVAERLGGLIVALEDPARQDACLSRLEALVGVDRRTLDEVLGLSRRALLRPAEPPRPVEGALAPFRGPSSDPLEEHTLALLFRYPDLAPLASSLTPEHFGRVENRELFRLWTQYGIIDIVKEHTDDLLGAHLDRLLNKPLPPSDLRERREALSQCFNRLEERRLRDLKALEELRLAAGEGEEVMEEAVSINQRLRALFQERTRNG